MPTPGPAKILDHAARAFLFHNTIVKLFATAAAYTVLFIAALMRGADQARQSIAQAPGPVVMHSPTDVPLELLRSIDAIAPASADVCVLKKRRRLLQWRGR
eukprot:10329638-Lingulodinium_polyedra.AAC.1